MKVPYIKKLHRVLEERRRDMSGIITRVAHSGFQGHGM
jgi:hypothetical protein